MKLQSIKLHFLNYDILFCEASRHFAVSDDGEDSIQKRERQNVVLHAQEQLTKGTTNESQNLVFLQLGASKDVG